MNSSVGKSVGNGTAEKKKVAVEHIVVSSENGNVENVHDDGNNTSLGLMQNMSSICKSSSVWTIIYIAFKYLQFNISFANR